MARESIRVYVPASSSNLGPGFDALGLALDFGLALTARAARRDRLRWGGEGAVELPLGRANRLWQAIELARTRWPGAPPLEVRARSAIPVGRGLGSSAAAIVAGLALGAAASGRQPERRELLRLGTSLEGHPDNIAACVHGGLVAAAVAEDGVHVQRLPFDRRLRLLLVIPHRRLPTARARAVLPRSLPRSRAVHNLQRLSLLIGALGRGRGELLAVALDDALHQPRRAALVPELEEVLALGRRDGLHGVCLSGAGPTLLAFVRRRSASLEARLRSILRRHGGGRLRYARVAARGLSWRGRL